MRRITFERANKGAEFLSFVALILGVPFGLWDMHSHAREAEENAEKERIEAAQKVYQTVDERYTEFVKLCIDHPELDCYSVAEPGEVERSLTNTQKLQQKMLYTELTDVFEVAYTQYNPRRKESINQIREIQQTEWAGWDNYIRKFINRPPYLNAWCEVSNEYDANFVKYMDSLAPHDFVCSERVETAKAFGVSVTTRTTK